MEPQVQPDTALQPSKAQVMSEMLNTRLLCWVSSTRLLLRHNPQLRILPFCKTSPSAASPTAPLVHSGGHTSPPKPAVPQHQEHTSLHHRCLGDIWGQLRQESALWCLIHIVPLAIPPLGEATPCYAPFIPGDKPSPTEPSSYATSGRDPMPSCQGRGQAEHPKGSHPEAPAAPARDSIPVGCPSSTRGHQQSHGGGYRAPALATTMPFRPLDARPLECGEAADGPSSRDL